MNTPTAPKHLRSLLCLLPLLLLAACGTDDEASTADPATTPAAGDDLPLGDISADDAKADGQWGHALECKALPDYEVLVKPEIHLSVHGLTLRLYDPVSGFEKVFPIGPGAIDKSQGSRNFGESLSYQAVLLHGGNTFEITPSTIQPCKTWHGPSGTPVFAGLPFLSFYGNYGIHGPIDNYRAANGGNLRRGFVSHGCFRMEADGILEVYARIKGVAHVPVYMHREAERSGDDVRVNVKDTWVGAECAIDSDCTYEGGACKLNPYSGRGWCTMPCTRACPDKAGYPYTFCVADPQAPREGICVNQVVAENFECRPYDRFAARTTGRFNEPRTTRKVCLPGGAGFVGDGCLAGTDCLDGLDCAKASEGDRGVCVQGCQRYCDDLPGYPTTFCAVDTGLGDGGQCVRTCDAARSGPECGSGEACVERARYGQASRKANVCVPQ